jgi:drug/metabolite transporter (DMT)-like permease
LKILGVFICFGGAVSVGLQDEESSSNTGSIGGDVMAILGSAGYGLYTTAMRYKVLILYKLLSCNSSRVKVYINDW